MRKSKAREVTKGLVLIATLVVCRAVQSATLVPSPSIVQRTPQGTIITNVSRAVISPADLTVSTSVPFDRQVLLHAQVINKIDQVLELASANLKAARTFKNFDDYVAAEEDIENAKKSLVPYAIAQAKAETLIAEGYRLYDLSGFMCINATCQQPVSPIVAVFFLASDKKKGLGPRFKVTPISKVAASSAVAPSSKNVPVGKLAGAAASSKSGDDDEPKNDCPVGEHCSICINGFNLCTFYDWVSDKPLENSPLQFIPEVRDRIIPPDNNGEIAKFIRDPGKTTLQDIQNIRDHIVPKNNNGEIAKIIRDPIKCTVGRLFHKC